MGYHSPKLPGYHYSSDKYLPSQASWKKLGFSPPDLFNLSKDCCLFCAGDGCLFAVVPSFECSGAVFKFCPAAGNWAVIVLSNPIGTVASVWARDGNRVYGCGLGDLHSLDVSTVQWEALPHTVTPRFCPPLSVVNGQLFVAGGMQYGSPYESLASVETYRPQRWVSVPDMPAEIYGAAALAFNGKLLIIGGTSKNGHRARGGG